MESLMLFTDGSVDVASWLGYGAYLMLSERGCSLDSLRLRVNVKRFEQTSSTRLELQTLLWALSEIQPSGRRIIIHTDSQNIIGLPERRARLEQNEYRSRQGRRLNHYELYQEFYRVFDRLDCCMVKVWGHQKSSQKTEIDQIFTLVDRASRNALRTAGI